MKKYTFWICFLLVAVTACRHSRPSHRTVSVSILPQKYFIERIAGDYLQVNVMIPPGMNPATCDLSTGELRKLYDSDLCFTIGYLPFELTHLYPVLNNRKEIPVINHSRGMEMLSGSCSHQPAGEHGHAGVDPHIWLSPSNARVMADTIYQVLARQYPEQAEAFRRNHQDFVRDIDSIANLAAGVMSRQKEKEFLIYHPALTYFAAEYGLEQISIEDEGKEPNPAHLKNIIDLAKDRNIRIIFIQSQFDISNAQAIAREIGAKVIPIDPLSANWTEEMLRLIRVFQENTAQP